MEKKTERLRDTLKITLRFEFSLINWMENDNKTAILPAFLVELEKIFS